MFEKFVLVATDKYGNKCYEAEYNFLEDARVDGEKLIRYYDEPSYNIWAITYDDEIKVVDKLLMDSVWK